MRSEAKLGGTKITIRRLALFATLTLTVSAASVAKDANSVLQEARQAMGTVTSIEYSGSGMNAFFGQALLAGKDWPAGT